MGGKSSILKHFEMDRFQGDWHVYSIKDSRIDYADHSFVKWEYCEVEQKFLYCVCNTEFINITKFKRTKKSTVLVGDDNLKMCIYWTDYNNYALVKHSNVFKIYSRNKDISLNDFQRLYSKIKK